MASACRLTVLRHDQLSEPLRIEPHHHDGVLQLDLVGDCRGRVYCGERWLRFDGPIALAAAPGRTHGYTLEPAGTSAVVYNIKLEPRTPLASLDTEPLPEFARTPAPGLFQSSAALLERTRSPGSPEIGAALILLGMLLDWPRSGHSAARRGVGRRVDPLIEQSVSVIESNLDTPLGLDEIAREVGLSGRQLARVFLRELGMSPHRYATIRRLDRAKTILLAGTTTIGETAELLGFSGHAAFTRWFTQHVGMNPVEFRSNPRVF